MDIGKLIDREDVKQMLLHYIASKADNDTSSFNSEESAMRVSRIPQYDVPNSSNRFVTKEMFDTCFDTIVPIALISSDASNLEEAEGSGIDMFLAKPFTYEQLICLVADAMKLKEMRQCSSCSEA